MISQRKRARFSADPPVLVGAVVGVLGKEAHHHVTDAAWISIMSMPASLQRRAAWPYCLTTSAISSLVVLALGHAHERAGGHVLGRSVGQKRIIARGTPLVAQLQLGGHLGSVLVAHLGDALEAGNELIVPASAAPVVVWYFGSVPKQSHT